MSNITIPKKLDPIVQAFFAESPQVAKKLVIQAAKAIYGSDDDKSPFDQSTRQPITNKEIEEICAFMQGIKPVDVLEAILAAQIVVSHMLGMRNMAKGHKHDQKLGLKMLQFSNEAIGRLQKKRSGGMQNVTVNYNYNGTPQATIPMKSTGTRNSNVT